MYLSHLSLTHFRNYRRLELDFTGPLTLLQGQNAQGKTNLLEAIHFLATSKSSHARLEREVVGWGARDEPIPYGQLSGQVHSQGRTLTLEILFILQKDRANFKKQVRINGVNRRALDLIGSMRAVLFLPEDIVLVTGAPGERRRYLDIALCQIDRAYCQHLSAYQKVLTQRNSLLKGLREEGAAPYAAGAEGQLGFWDEKLVHHGAAVMARRYRFMAALDAAVRTRHADLTRGQETLNLHYLPSFNPGHLSEGDFRRLSNGQLASDTASLPREPLSVETVRRHFQAKLHDRRARELAMGSTLYGPHRDDMVFVVNGWDLRTYGSRGQQRTAALSLKLAELQTMSEETGEAPLLLLDDVMSELDAQRRATLLAALNGVEQAIITTTDWGDFSEEFRRKAQLLQVQGGEITSA